LSVALKDFLRAAKFEKVPASIDYASGSSSMRAIGIHVGVHRATVANAVRTLEMGKAENEMAATCSGPDRQVST
jgi:hypothetical protein